MARILLVEYSANLRNVLCKKLDVAGHSVESSKNFNEALSWLHSCEAGHPNRQYDVIVLGWLKKQSAGSKQVLKALKQPGLSHLPVLVTYIEEDPALFQWVKQRPFSECMDLNDYFQIQQHLSLLLDQTPAHHIEPFESEQQSQLVRILFVDDSRTFRKKISMLLTQQGYEVELAANATEGLQKALSFKPDIAIIDYFMPDFNGDELCRRLQAKPETACIMMSIFTATYVDNVIQDSLDAGASDCMFKNEAEALFIARVSAMSRTILAHRTVENDRQRLQGILGSIGEGVYGVDTQGRLTFINPAARRILGYSSKQSLVGKSAQALFHYAHSDSSPNPPETCFLQQAYELGDELNNWETTFWNSMDETVPIECTVYPLRIDKHLRGSVVAFRDISRHKKLESDLKWAAHHDPLTKLENRYSFDHHLAFEVSRIRHNRRASSGLLYIDLDRFKYINDTAGHKAGDELLITVGKQLQSRLRTDDLLARLGGDEFAVILYDIRPYDLPSIAEQFRSILDDSKFTWESKTYKINGSVGATLINMDSSSADEVLANADIACHVAKQKGRNQVHIYDQNQDDKLIMDVELGWSARLHEALEKNGFILHYQPIVDMQAVPSDFEALNEDDATPLFEIDHYEVLVRIPGKTDDTLIFPNAFLPTAERFNLMHHIDHWIINKALSELNQRDESAEYPLNIRLSINLSGHSLGNAGLKEAIPRLLKQYQIDPQRITFEITETAAIENIVSAQEFIADIAALGCKFSLDDFGVGFSSFAHLKHLNVDYIKIDGLFIRDLKLSDVDQAMVKSIIEIARALGIYTIAEFVETTDQIRLLKAFGVDYVQGYGIAKPQSELSSGTLKTE